MKDSLRIRRKRREVLRKIKEEYAQPKYTLALLLDISDSMAGRKIKNAKEALLHFLKSVDLAKNKAGLVAFGGGVRTSDLSRDYTYLERKIKSFKADDGTPMMQGIRAAYENLLRKGISPVMVIATDGQPTDASEEGILEYAGPIKQKGVRIITIGIGDDVNESFLKRLASSPKDYHFAKASFELKKIYKKVADVLALPGKKPNHPREG